MFHKKCSTCTNKICLELAPPKPCGSVENYLERLKSKEGYSNRHIRRKEIPYTDESLSVVGNNSRISVKNPQFMSFIESKDYGSLIKAYKFVKKALMSEKDAYCNGRVYANS